MVSTRLNYSHTIGIASFEGRGFMNPIDIKYHDGILYVLSRSNGSNKNNRISAVTLDSEHKFEFANWGEENGKSILPTSIAFDKNNLLYLSDEHLNRISVFDLEGNFKKSWGELGSEENQINRPSGIVFNNENEIFVVDHINSKIKKFDSNGNFISSFGSFGTKEGQFNYPWGITLGKNENIYIADWRNNRVQKFDKDGNFINSIKNYGAKAFNRPSSVHIDEKGYLFVSNWGNDSVVIFDDKENFIYELIGDATLSKWCKEFLEVNPEQSSWRENAGLLDEEKKFWKPTGIESNEDLIFIADACRHRVQIYQK